MEGSLWAIATVLGPVLLGLALIWGVMSYRKRGAAAKLHTEAATRRLYREREQDRLNEDTPPLQPR
jgi:hypothetical protein